VELRVEWSVHPQQASAVGVAAQSVANADRREQGCLTCSLATDMGDHVTLRLREVWDSEASLRRHLSSRRFETLAGLLETALEPPRIEFALEGRIRGLDYVGEVRQRTGPDGSVSRRS
jgi:quinol monooxygenase YgiN